MSSQPTCLPASLEY